MAVAGGDEKSLEYTPTWVVALVCFCIVFISITVDRFFRCTGQLFKMHNTWPLIGATQKIKDELTLLGFISLLLSVFQTRIGKICMSEQLNNVYLPCKKPDSSSTVASFSASFFASSGTLGRRLLPMASATTNYCSQKGKVPLLSVEAVHHLHIFIFVLAISHVMLCLLKVLSMIKQWRNLKIYHREFRDSNDAQELVARAREFHENPPGFFGYMVLVIQKGITSMSFFEYVALCVNFPQARATNDPGEDFQKYIMRTLQKEFEKIIGISWYLWLLAVIYLLVNVAGWHAYFWISFIPLIIWFIVHFKLEDIIRRLATTVAKKLEKNEKEMVVEISECEFWFRRPRLIGNLIHIVLFENSLELAFFFFILFQYGFHSCIMEEVGFVVPRIAIGTLVQVLCMIRTFPLYAIIMSQMHLKKYRSDERMKECLDDLDEIKKRLEENGMDQEEEMWIVARISMWIDKVKNRRKETRSKKVAAKGLLTQMGTRDGSVVVETPESSDMNSTGDIEAPIDDQPGTNINWKQMRS